MVKLIVCNAELKTGFVKERSGTFKVELHTIKPWKGLTDAAKNNHIAPSVVKTLIILGNMISEITFTIVR